MRYSTAQVVYPCCEVGDTITYPWGDNPLVTPPECWNCSKPTGKSYFDIPTNSPLYQGFKQTSATYRNHMPTEEFKLWAHP